MKKIFLALLALSLCLGGCFQSKGKDEEAPVIELSHKRVQVSVGDSIDYQSYIKNVSDNVDQDLKKKVTYNKIETSKIGKYTIVYEVKDSAGNQARQELVVDVVTMFDDDIYSPIGIEVDTVDHPEDVTVLVNKVNQIPEGWEPDDLVTVIDGTQQLRKEAAEAYNDFYKAAQNKGITLYSISGYRTQETQTRYWTNMVNVYGEEYASQYSAYPGRSEHQLGLAMDVSYTTVGDRLSEAVEDSDIGQFIISDGYKYGFILRYPKDKVAITNYGYEPWHIRYVGVDLATKLHKSGQTLEEYYDQK